ncbi:hypothetical protein F7725_022952 [Dissostichus mawsoni]|uniref:Dolichyl-diphosphooligosaccharide-protein glycosyltransferase subunit TMEM258 n=1 Tax=Dissostichus mawsoni TaxID=36200 RepID=A0A7J5Z289_DISMA|nr:hypothetical protein F7725_022952 [Dissostichus mawsoni]
MQSKMELEAMTRYTSPVNPAVFPHLTVVLLAIGMFFTAWFFVYEVTSTKYTRDVYKELLISSWLHFLWASVCCSYYSGLASMYEVLCDRFERT